MDRQNNVSFSVRSRPPCGLCLLYASSVVSLVCVQQRNEMWNSEKDRPQGTKEILGQVVTIGGISSARKAAFCMCVRCMHDS